MNGINKTYLVVLLGALFVLSACQPSPPAEINYDPADLRFSGETAFELEAEFVNNFPDRASGRPNNALAAEWLFDRFSDFGWTCTTDEWSVVNFSQPLPLQNVICRLPGASNEEILLIAHHDQSPQTIYGADNDGSGVAILLHLAQLFGDEPARQYTITIIAADGEEYGMLGSLRYVNTHPDPSQIIAAVSLDNVGKVYYDGVGMSPIGQYRNYGPAWLLRSARDSATAAADSGVDIWVPLIRDPFTQIIDQTVPISFMDQGPLVAAGVPAVGFYGNIPPEFAEEVYESYHSPSDVMALQSPLVLQNIGRATEALVRQLQTMTDFPVESGPYIYFEASEARFSGPALWLIFILFVAIFFAGALWPAGNGSGLGAGWRRALPHFLGLWLPLVLAVVSLYVLTAVGLLQRFDRYFALPKSPAYFEPRWPAIILFLIGLGVFLFVGRQGAGRYTATIPKFAARKQLAMLVIGLAGVYALLTNPFSLLLMVPVLFWLLIRGRMPPLDLLLFILGFALVIYLFYQFGFVVLRIDFLVLWYVLMMMAVPMVGLPTMMAVTAIIAAGLSLLVRPPWQNTLAGSDV